MKNIGVSYLIDIGGITSILTEASSLLTGLGVGVATLAIIILGFVIMGGGGSGLQKGKGIAINICVGAVVIGAAGAIAGLLFGGGGA